MSSTRSPEDLHDAQLIARSAADAGILVNRRS
jgi:hypothetical protein